MWLGIGYIIPMKGDKAGEPLPFPSSKLISEKLGDFLISEKKRGSVNTGNTVIKIIKWQI